MSKDHYIALGPKHPIKVMERMAYATPNPCEGSIGHLRSDFAWELVDDYRRACESDESILGVYDPPTPCSTFAEVRRSCTKDAVDAIIRWTIGPRRRLTT